MPLPLADQWQKLVVTMGPINISHMSEKGGSTGSTMSPDGR